MNVPSSISAFPIMGISYQRKGEAALEKGLLYINSATPYYTWDWDFPWNFKDNNNYHEEVPIRAFLTSAHKIVRDLAKKALKNGIYDDLTTTSFKTFPYI